MDEPSDSEAALAALWRAGARSELVTGVMRAYGPEILSYLVTTMSADGEAAEAFSQFAFNLWQASDSYRGESSFRTWAYALARHAVGRVARERGKRRRHVRLSSVPEIEALAVRVRTETLEHLRTETKDRLWRLRQELSPDDQTILILRVDRKLTWPDIARVMTDGDPPGADALARKVVALRKRFERIKETLKRRASEG